MSLLFLWLKAMRHYESPHDLVLWMGFALGDLAVLALLAIAIAEWRRLWLYTHGR